MDCNPQVLVTLGPEARRVEWFFCLREVIKDIFKGCLHHYQVACEFRRVACDERRPVVAHEISLMTGAIALLGHANVRYHINRRFVMKRELI